MPASRRSCTPWLPWYAWRPVKVETGHIVWLGMLERWDYVADNGFHDIKYRLPSSRRASAPDGDRGPAEWRGAKGQI